MFEKFKQEWEDTPRGQRWGFVGATGLGLAAIAIHAAFFPRESPDQVAKQTAATTQVDQANPDGADFHARSALPNSNRNQGLEDLSMKIDKMTDRMAALESGRGAPPVGQGGPSSGLGNARGGQQQGSTPPVGSSTQPSPTSSSVNLDEIIPNPTFTQDGAAPSAMGGLKQPGSGGGGIFATSAPEAASAVERAQARMKVWDAPQAGSGDDDVESLKRDAEPEQEVIPVNGGMESVLLSGFNARPSGSSSGANGSAQSANTVGAPFVTRLKGDAILPNGWRVGDLGDCFLGGSAVAVLSAERAYAIADQLSCVKPNGEVYEGPVKAYALDVDGTLGLACKVVSKQGSLLMQAALTGMVSGLGQVLAPTSIPTFNNSGTNGSTQGYTYPNLGAAAATSVGTGVQQASGQLSKFYLQYANEVFPVCEVTATTRATWVLKESVVLKRRRDMKEKT